MKIITGADDFLNAISLKLLITSFENVRYMRNNFM